MFDEKHALLEVVKAIEELRERHGTTSKQICEFIRKRSKDPNDPMKVLKTARTLNKLVEEGILVKRGRRYMFPNSKAEKQLEAGDRSSVLENAVELEDEIDDEDWLISDEESPHIEVPSKKKRSLPKRGKKQNPRKRGRRRYDEAGPSSDFHEFEEIERSRSPVRNRKINPDSVLEPWDEPELVDKDEQRSQSELSLTAQGTSDDHTAVESHRFESTTIPPPSNPQVPSAKQKSSCVDYYAEQEFGADQEEDILKKIKIEKDCHRKSSSRRSSSKVRERQSRKKERDEIIEKGRVEKFNRSCPLDFDSIVPESSLQAGSDDNIP